MEVTPLNQGKGKLPLPQADLKQTKIIDWYSAVSAKKAKLTTQPIKVHEVKVWNQVFHLSNGDEKLLSIYYSFSPESGEHVSVLDTDTPCPIHPMKRLGINKKNFKEMEDYGRTTRNEYLERALDVYALKCFEYNLNLSDEQDLEPPELVEY